MIHIVSNVESNGTREEAQQPREALERQLHEIERGSVAPWIEYPAAPWWWPALFGVWTATYTLSFELGDGATRSLVQLAHLLVVLGAVWWMRRWRGTYPTGRSPRELNGSFVLLFVGAGVISVAIWGSAAMWGLWPAALLGGVLAWGLVVLFERVYSRAAARVRERLG